MSDIRPNNSSGVPCFAIVDRPSGPYIRVSWSVGGVCGRSEYSTLKHGALGAIKQAITAREAATGQPVGLKPRTILNKLLNQRA